MRNYLMNQGLMTSGIVRAFVINRGDYRAFIPALMNENILVDGQLNEETYEKIKETLPLVLFNSMALKDLVGTNPTPCWVAFENGDINKPVVMGFFGNGVKSVSGEKYTNDYSGGSPSYNYSGDGNGNQSGGRILLVAGRGNGDPGATGNGYTEANLTREFVSLLSGSISCDVFDTSKNMFKDLKGESATETLKQYNIVIEIHFNASAGGNGSELLVRNKNNPTTLETKVLNALVSAGFKNRGFKDGTWLGNMSKAITANVSNYFLVEVCFIDSESDMNIYQKNKNTIIANIAQAFKG